MNKTFITIISAILMANLSIAQQHIELPSIQLTNYNIDSLKAVTADTQILISQLQQIKAETENDIEKINIAQQTLNLEKQNSKQLKKLLLTKQQLICTQKEQLKQEETNRYKEKKLIEKALQQLEKDTQLSDSARFSYQQALKARINMLNASQITWNNNKNDLLAKENQLQNEKLELQQREVEIKSHQINLKHLLKTTKIKIKQLTSEINFQKNKL